MLRRPFIRFTYVVVWMQSLIETFPPFLRPWIWLLLPFLHQKAHPKLQKRAVSSVQNARLAKGGGHVGRTDFPYRYAPVIALFAKSGHLFQMFGPAVLDNLVEYGPQQGILANFSIEGIHHQTNIFNRCYLFLIHFIHFFRLGAPRWWMCWILN